jgi:transposase InsO family protein
MGRTGSCYDNARMESFFATLKKELIYNLPMYRLTCEEVRSLVFEWIEGYYNLRRRHTSNDGHMAPLVKRKLYQTKKAA